MSHVRGPPFHPQTQGKIEHWHQTLKNRILLENCYLPGDPEAQVEAFVKHQAAAVPGALPKAEPSALSRKPGQRNA